MRYKSKKEAQQDHLTNYRSDGVAKQKGHKYSSDHYRVRYVIENVPKKAYVLDVGCNGGTIALHLLERGCRVKGIDLVPELVAKAKKRGVFAEVGEAEDLSRFKDSTFDCVICAEVLEHLFDPLVAIEEAHRVLKSGGKYVVTVPHMSGEMCSNDKLGDYHQQNFSWEILCNLFQSVFGQDNIRYMEIPYTEIYCKSSGSDPKRPQWLGFVATKSE